MKIELDAMKNEQTRQRVRAGWRYLRPRSAARAVSLYRTIYHHAVWASNDVGQQHAWGNAPASATEKSAVERVRSLLHQLRTEASQLPPWLAVELIPPDIDDRIESCDWSLKAYKPTSEQAETRPKRIWAEAARHILRELDLPATTTVGSDWCRLAAALYFYDEREHSKMRRACLVLK